MRQRARIGGLSRRESARCGGRCPWVNGCPWGPLLVATESEASVEAFSSGHREASTASRLLRAAQRRRIPMRSVAFRGHGSSIGRRSSSVATWITRTGKTGILRRRARLLGWGGRRRFGGLVMASCSFRWVVCSTWSFPLESGSGSGGRDAPPCGGHLRRSRRSRGVRLAVAVDASPR